MNYSYALPRSVLYGLTWVFSVVLLGLTGYRIHHTKNLPNGFAFYDPGIAELLVAAILTLIWVPISLTLLLKRTRTEWSSAGLHSESVGLFVLWVLYLVGAAVTTHRWPSTSFCGTGKQCDILITINAFSWIIFGFISIIFLFIIMHYSAADAAESSVAEKRRPETSTAAA